MQTYYGGRAECRIRKTKVPVIHTDFTSQYPTVNALLRNWDVLKARSIRFENCTREARRLLSKVSLDATFDSRFWKKLSFFALVKPRNDILPIRRCMAKRPKTLALTSFTPRSRFGMPVPTLWRPDFLPGKSPHVVKAIRMVANGCQSELQATNLGRDGQHRPSKRRFLQESD